MPIRAVCVDCRSKLRVPDEMAGQWVQCPKCNQLVQIPKKSELPTKDKLTPRKAVARVSEAAQTAGSFAGGVGRGLSTPTGLGFASLALGLLSVSCLVVPWLGFYLDLAFGSVGLVLGLVGLILAKVKGERLLGYSLAGCAACLVGLILAYLGRPT